MCKYNSFYSVIILKCTKNSITQFLHDTIKSFHKYIMKFSVYLILVFSNNFDAVTYCSNGTKMVIFF